GERGNVDDVSAAGANHRGGESADAVVRTAQVRVEYLFPGFGRQLVEGTSKTSHTRVVDQNVDTAMSLDEVSGSGFYGLQAGHVTLHCFGPTGSAGNCAGGLIERGAGSSQKQHGSSETR